MDATNTLNSPLPSPLYQRLAMHYRSAIEAGSLVPGDRMPSLRALMRQHGISLSTALQLSRQLESEGWLQARPRSGYFVRRPLRSTLATVAEPLMDVIPDPAQYVGIHDRVSDFIARGRLQPVKTNLSAARCAPELYPAHALQQSALRVLRRHPDVLVTAAASTKGSPEFRAALAKRALGVGLTLSPDDIQVTHGCIEALNLALRAAAQPGDTIAVESPTFHGLLQVLESLGLQALEIPTSPQTGISMEALELALQTYPHIKAVVVVPYLQNPLGSIMPDTHKQRLVQLCDEHAMALIEDDCYSELVNERRRADTPMRAIKSWDKTGNVIYCSSLHKVLAPGLRLGWMVAGRWQARVEMFKHVQTRSNEQLSQLAAAEFIASPAYDRHLRRLRAALLVQREKSAEIIASSFPPGTRLNEPEGGLALWVELPQKLSSNKVFDAALKEKILIAPGLMFSNSLRFDAYLRISCGSPHDAQAETALRRLGQIVGELLVQS